MPAAVSVKITPVTGAVATLAATVTSLAVVVAWYTDLKPVVPPLPTAVAKVVPLIVKLKVPVSDVGETTLTTLTTGLISKL